MSSPDHRANILNPNYTALGIGSAYAASGWNGPAAAAQPRASGCSPRSSPSCPPSGRRRPIRPAPSPTSPTRTAPATAVATPAPTPTPTPTPTPPRPRPAAPTPTPLPAPGPPLPAYESSGQGLISDTIEATLEAFLFY